MARQVGSPGFLLLAWVITGVLTVAAALSYGELAAMLPRAGGRYVYLREAFSPLWGFLYGWTLFLVIQTGTIAAVAVGFARYVGVLWPGLSEERYLIAPVNSWCDGDSCCASDLPAGSHLAGAGNRPARAAGVCRLAGRSHQSRAALTPLSFLCMANSKIREHFLHVPRSCEDCAVRDLAVLLLHLVATVARVAGPGGARSVVAESVLVKHQLLILNRSRKRSANLRPADRDINGSSCTRWTASPPSVDWSRSTSTNTTGCFRIQRFADRHRTRCTSGQGTGCRPS
jgi:hypothetical protein